MLDFSINFLSQTSIQFIDNSNAGDYSALSTLKTRLSVVRPLIADNEATPEVLELFDENIGTLTDNFTFTALDELVDGVYRMTLNLYDDVGATSLVGTPVVKYFIQDYSIQACLKNQVDALICANGTSCSTSWCDVAKYNAILDSAKYAAEQDQVASAEDMVAYLTDECLKINCIC